VGGIILYLLPSAILLVCVYSPVFKVENNIENLCSKGCQLLSKADIPVEKLISLCHFT
jgi:hypothetical protein